MAKDWQELTQIADGESLTIERVCLTDRDVCIEGSFDLPPMAQLTTEDQIFVAAFVRSHGSIKQMEQFFGVSYPTVKNRLNRISEKLSFVAIEPVEEKSDILTQLERGEISAKEAIDRLKR
ncbi:MAG: DUF2089 domain-containing protein [candidate division Zixibacteria bacterium]|nr:DUF2089 domain-containing protein [candidate division Zixibacteria bacterium]